MKTKFLSKNLMAAAVAAGLFCVMGVASARAATNYVAFGGSSLTFRPSALTIHVGDTVIWTNAGGFHTVTGSSPGEPLCGCTSGNTSALTNTFTFAGTFPYYCVYHQSFGMTGVINVVGAPPSPAVLGNAAWTNGGFVFKALTTPNQTNVVQATTNLTAAPSWISLDTNVPATNFFIFTDPNAARFPHRFYRVVQP